MHPALIIIVASLLIDVGRKPQMIFQFWICVIKMSLEEICKCACKVNIYLLSLAKIVNANYHKKCDHDKNDFFK